MCENSPLSIQASYIRGGTSKGVFFALDDLPSFAVEPGEARDSLLLRVVGSPDPYGKHTDGMGGATSSTSKVVIISRSNRIDCDLNYLFGQVAIDRPKIDWSGNCGNLSAAVAGFGISRGMLDPEKIPRNGFCEVRIWQENISKVIVAKVPIVNGLVQEDGGFELDGVAFPAAEILLDFVDPGDDSAGSVFPSGSVLDKLEVPGHGEYRVTLINSGIPTVFLHAQDLGYSGTELQDDINSDLKALEKFENIRKKASLAMGLVSDQNAAAELQHTPKIAMVSAPKEYISSSGKKIRKHDVDVTVRAFSMGKLHHAMMGTAAVAIASAAAIPGTVISECLVGGPKSELTFGHPSGILKVGAEAERTAKGWVVNKVSMSRSARLIMEGQVKVPGSQFSSLSESANK